MIITDDRKNISGLALINRPKVKTTNNKAIVFPKNQPLLIQSEFQDSQESLYAINPFIFNCFTIRKNHPPLQKRTIDKQH